MGPIKLSRDCEATEIPSGRRVRLPAGSEVKITQSLGGSYTVVSEGGSLLRIEGKDADAIGMKSQAAPGAEGPPQLVDPKEVEKLVWAQLRTVFDPEIPVNVVDLGLIYLCQVNPLAEGGFKVEVKMTLTAPGCGMGSVLQADAQSKILTIPGVKEARVEMVVDPPWNPSMMSEAAKLQLGMI